MPKHTLTCRRVLAAAEVLTELQKNLKKRIISPKGTGLIDLRDYELDALRGASICQAAKIELLNFVTRTRQRRSK